MRQSNEQSGRRLIAIGDIHGCVHALDALLAVIAPAKDDTIVVLGDFIDQGRDTKDVIDRLLSVEETCRLVCLRGNHEEMLLAATTCERTRRYWENAGGVATLYSYRFGGTIDDIPDEHIRFLARCRDYYETERFIFVHANFDPDRPMRSQSSQTLRWQVLEPDARRHHSGKTVICGHSEQVAGEILDLDGIRCIDTACWHYGWLTALEVNTGQVWQASRFGILRTDKQTPVGRIQESA